MSANRHPRLTIALLLLTSTAHAAENLPVTPAETLSGHKLEFPTALAGKTAVCVFGFSKGAGDRTKVWMERLSHDGIDAWSVANLEKAPAMVRGMIRGGMRKGTPASQLDHSLIMTKDEQIWRQALGVKQDNLPVVVLLDSSGQIFWKYEGVFSDEAYQQLKSRLASSAR